MVLLQVKIDEKLSDAIKGKADSYGVPVSSLVKIVLARSFLGEARGNVFNANRDGGGKGVMIDDLVDML